MVKIVFLSGFFFLNLTIAVAAPPSDDFENDALLSAVSSEISDLKVDQLNSVIEYIASCSPAPGPARDFACEQAIEKLQIKAAKEPALQTLRRAITTRDRLISWSSPVGARGMKDIDRRIAIFESLRQAASARYYQLTVS